MWRFLQPIFATVILCFPFFYSIGQNAPVVVKQETERLNLQQSIVFLEDANFSPPEALSQIGSGKLLSDSTELDPKKAYWLYLDIVSQSTVNQNMILGMGKVDIGMLHFRSAGSNAEWQILKSGWAVPKSEKQKVRGGNEDIQFEIELKPSQQYEVLIKIENPTYAKFQLSPNLKKKITWENDFLEERVVSNVILGVVFGFLGIMFCYNFLVFVFSKEKIYLYYSIYILMGFVYILNFSGFLLDNIFASYPRGYLLFRNLPPNIGFIAYALFAQNLLNTKELLPKWHIGFNVTKYWMAVNIAVIVLVLPFTMNQLYTRLFPIIGHLFTQLFLMAFIIRLFFSSNTLGRYFAIGAFMFSSASIIAVYSIAAGLLPITGVLSIEFLGLAGELIAFSLGLGYKIKLAEKEKRRAQEETANLLKTQNETLERKVKERTEEITTQNEELHQQQEEIIAQRDYIESQNKDLRYKNDQITDSIRYAQTIQEAILPFEERFDSIFAEHFIFYRPKDIVSGDFYWLDTVGNTKLIAVLDCTGHGVPGGFMSMVGFSILNDIVLKERETSPAEILEKLNTNLVRVLKQEDSQAINRDGMDVGLCAIHEDSGSNKVKVVFCGAKRPLYYVEPSVGELKEVKGDRKTIGGYQPKDKRFGDKVLELEKGSTLYLTTDGFADQNNSKGKKFGSPALRQLLGEISSKSLEEQHTGLSKVFDMHSDGQPQRDDVAIIGIKV